MQSQALKLVESTGFPVVLGFEFYPTLTVGSKLRADPKFSTRQGDLDSQGVHIVDTEEEESHFYSPGQLVIYPLVPLKKLQLSLADLIKILEESTRLWLQKYKVNSFTGDRPGLFTGAGQIAFLSAQELNGISRFGISIHLSDDPKAAKDFITNEEQDSIFNYNVDLDLKAAFEEWILYWTSELLKAIPNSK
jgi:lipoate-protein ligase B